jgi:hypothetical protein
VKAGEGSVRCPTTRRTVLSAERRAAGKEADEGCLGGGYHDGGRVSGVVAGSWCQAGVVWGAVLKPFKPPTAPHKILLPMSE